MNLRQIKESKHMSAKKILIVNPFISSEFLVTKLHARGIQVIGLQTLNHTQDFSKLFDLWIEDYSANLDEALTKLSSQPIDFVINGADESVHTTDLIAQHITPKLSNPVATSKQRSNKFSMQQALAAAGLTPLKQTLIRTANVQQITAHGIEYPCFIKPLDGIGSFMAKIIASSTELNAYFNSFKVLNNYLTGQKLSGDFLVQELIRGDEYSIDTFSVQGYHYISSVQRHNKKIRRQTPINMFDSLIHANSTEYQQCVNFATQCLDASGLNNGFSHLEMFLTATGPRLVEINPRISGRKGMVNLVAEFGGYASQPDLLADYILNTPLAKTKQKAEFVYNVLLYPNRNRCLKPITADLLRQYCPSYSHHQQFLSGDYTKPSTGFSLADTALSIILSSNKAHQVSHDLANLINSEHDEELF